LTAGFRSARWEFAPDTGLKEGVWTMGISVGEIVRRVGGKLYGDESVQIEGAQSIGKAGPGEVTFALDELNLRHLRTTQPSVIIVPPKKFEAARKEYTDRNWIVSDDAFGAFIEILQYFRPQKERTVTGISPQAIVASTAIIGPGCNIHAGAVIGEHVTIGAGCDIHSGAVISAECRIGDHCIIYPNAVLYSQVLVGNRVIIHASAVIGADGFGYRFLGGRFVKIPQLGTVHLADDVEIGACTTVDRAMIGATVIGEGTKLDNLIMIGHNCELGKHNAFASQVGLAGSVTTGDYVRMAGQVGVADHVHIGTQAILGAKAGIHRDMEGGKTYLGAPATEDHEQFKIAMAIRKLPEMRLQLQQLRQQVADLAQLLDQQEKSEQAA
jgi:UDP-3-O-[3-hydroxymyristoyl] glucosamine N-acyltransferase